MIHVGSPGPPFGGQTPNIKNQTPKKSQKFKHQNTYIFWFLNLCYVGVFLMFDV
jgi:hypothetical protein